MTQPPPLRFNPRPSIEALPIARGERCWVIDDALVDPESWVEFAATHRAAFGAAQHNAYPGPELRLTESACTQHSLFFSQHLRERLGARRVLRTTSKLAITTQDAASLQPRQSLCHVDRLEAVAGQCIAASVLYLFADSALGGTSFFVPRRPVADLAVLLADANRLDATAFHARHGIAPGYMVDSNDWFQRVATLPARFNRLIAYNGAIFHSGDIRAPERLLDDPRRGRLSLNSFFVCSRRLAA